MAKVTSKAVKLHELSEKIMIENICPDLASQATQLVFGEGSEDADLLFIGEAPGKKEDKEGKPFIGASGRILNEMLESINIKRIEVYITNIVKYRPPENRDPTAAEKKAFLPVLEEQINIISPKLIVTLGRHSMDCLLPGLKISEVHGNLKQYLGRACLPLFHPAAALYNGGLRQTLLTDFATIPNILQKIN